MFVSHFRGLKERMQREPLLWVLLVVTFFLRFAGVMYGLPLSVVADEATFVYGSLLMIKLHTVLPALHPEFQSILYYPPYLSYIFLAPFTLILGLQYIFWHGDHTLFQVYVAIHTSPFFATARLVNVMLGTLSVYLVYRIAENLFRTRIAALSAAFLLATSILHGALSMVGRQWVPVSTIMLLVLFVLVRKEWNVHKRYIAAFIIAGLGMGISSISALDCALIGFCYICFDMPRERQLLRDTPVFLVGTGLFVVLSAVAWFLYHGGSSFVGSITFFEPKSLTALLWSPWSALSLIVYSEPVLVVFGIVGFIYCVFSERKVATLVATFFMIYVAVFYLFFRFEPRFIVPIIPFLALLGGYGTSRLWNYRTVVVLCIFLCIPMIIALRLSYLATQSDTRTHARAWILQHLTPSDRVLVYSSAMHIPTQTNAVKELRAIDPGALRKIDEADEIIDRQDIPYTLNNLSSVVNEDFLQKLPTYTRTHGYAYLLLEPSTLERSATTTKETFALITKHATVVAHFEGFGDDSLGPTMSVAESAFTEPFTVLFQNKSLGSDIVIYRLQ